MVANNIPKLYVPTIKELPAQDRPRERLAALGPGALSTAELVAIVLHTGSGGESALSLASRVLVRCGGVAGLAQAGLPQLMGEKGIGLAKATQLQAALELGRRLVLAAPEERPQIRSPADAAQLLLLRIGGEEQEHFWALFLDTRNRVLGHDPVYKGTLNQSHIRVGDVFREAVRSNAAALIVAHNHPSGDPAPSPEDVAVTRELIAAGKLLGIDVLDHLVIGRQRWVSLRERGLGFEAGA